MLIIGIVSADRKVSQRNAQRETWLSSGLFPYRFLLDRKTPELELENEKFGDIVFLNATHSGYAVAYGEKLDIWFKYAMEHFPNRTLYGKVDDDVFVCAEEMYKTLVRIAHSRLYYGFLHTEWLSWKDQVKYWRTRKPKPLPESSRYG